MSSFKQTLSETFNAAAIARAAVYGLNAAILCGAVFNGVTGVQPSFATLAKVTAIFGTGIFIAEAMFPAVWKYSKPEGPRQ